MATSRTPLIPPPLPFPYEGGLVTESINIPSNHLRRRHSLTAILPSPWPLSCLLGSCCFSRNATPPRMPPPHPAPKFALKTESLLHPVLFLWNKSTVSFCLLFILTSYCIVHVWHPWSCLTPRRLHSSSNLCVHWPLSAFSDTHTYTQPHEKWSSTLTTNAWHTHRCTFTIYTTSNIVPSHTKIHCSATTGLLFVPVPTSH